MCRTPPAFILSASSAGENGALRTAARVRELEAATAMAKGVQQLNCVVILWYDPDPAQATGWLDLEQRMRTSAKLGDSTVLWR